MKLSLKDLKAEGAYIEKFSDTNIIHLLGDSFADDLFIEWVNSTEGSVIVDYTVNDPPTQHLLQQLKCSDVNFWYNNTTHRVFNSIKMDNRSNTFDHSELDSIITRILYSGDVPEGTYLGTLITEWKGSKKNTIVKQYLVK